MSKYVGSGWRQGSPDGHTLLLHHPPTPSSYTLHPEHLRHAVPGVLFWGRSSLAQPFMPGIQRRGGKQWPERRSVEVNSGDERGRECVVQFLYSCLGWCRGWQGGGGYIGEGVVGGRAKVQWAAGLRCSGRPGCGVAGGLTGV